MKSLLLIACLLVPTVAKADDLKLPSGIFLAGAALDNVTTQVFLHRGQSEGNIALRFAHDDPVKIAVFAAATDSATLWLAHRIAPNHPKIAKVALYSLGAARVAYGLHNLRNMAAPPCRVQVPTVCH